MKSTTGINPQPMKQKKIGELCPREVSAKLPKSLTINWIKQTEEKRKSRQWDVTWVYQFFASWVLALCRSSIMSWMADIMLTHIGQWWVCTKRQEPRRVIRAWDGQRRCGEAQKKGERTPTSPLWFATWYLSDRPELDD